MRIRKYAQRSQTSCLPTQLPSSNCQRESPSTLVCVLNRSPWDVMSFTSEVMREDDIFGEETASEVERTWEDDNKLEKKDISCSSSSSPMVISVSEKESREGVMNYMEKKSCNKTDGKGWKCKNEAKGGHSLCEHHLTQLKSYYTKNKNNYLSNRGLKSNGAQARGKRTSSKISSSNYYYYTGFGPEWGGKDRVQSKRRYMDVNSGSSSSSSDNTAGEDNGNIGKKKKKARKPVKTRSLKSLL
ncbi:hypothetical protein NE237_013570 [Protea cynaroides]|uniref:WRC domain-containing protein n=1 Tax=Protea cynaroides TaxID=273540 RepID=A0A9Q0H390_9MAGN|nr:hypothetical protein NE237_013570 [Protea cynaroides]